ncbi:MAG: cytidine deaminase [Pseudomonadota bacterium]
MNSGKDLHDDAEVLSAVDGSGNFCSSGVMSSTSDQARAYLAQSSIPALPAEFVGQIIGDLSIAELMFGLIPLAADYAQPRISGYKVGAVGLTPAGMLAFGTNFEFDQSALAQTVHAEQCLIANLVAMGAEGLSKIAISAAPCGHCRQFLNELADADDLEVIIPNHPPIRLKALLPEAFGPKDLDLEAGLMNPVDNRLQPVGAVSPLGQLALAAANSSYAPYSKAPSGVALELADGRQFGGAYLENAAYNPSLPALQSAMAQLVMVGGKPEDVVAYAAAELPNAPVKQFAFVQDLFARVAPEARAETIVLAR